MPSRRAKRLERLGGHSPGQLTDAMMWLAGYGPATFEAVMDAAEPCVCGRYGANIGIVVIFGLDWRHYRGSAVSEAELIDARRAPNWAGASLQPPRSDETEHATPRLRLVLHQRAVTCGVAA